MVRRVIIVSPTRPLAARVGHHDIQSSLSISAATKVLRFADLGSQGFVKSSNLAGLWTAS
jgi:hypothetical protein